MTRTVSRALAVFDAFEPGHTALTLQEIGDRIGLAKATAFRLVHTLEKEGYLLRLPTQRYGLSAKFIRLAGLVHDTLPLREAARAVMGEVNRASGETITLNLRSGLERAVLDVVETPAPLMAVARAGERISLLYGAAGRVLLGFAPPQERSACLAKLLPGTSLDQDAFQQDLARIEAAGFAISHGQRVPGLTAIAAPILEADGRANHCLALSGPSIRTDSRETELVALVRDAARRVSNRLGWTQQS